MPAPTAAPPGRDRAAGPGWFPYALIAPAMITLVVVALVPFLYTVYLSLHEIRHAQVGGWAGLANYQALLGNPRFWHSTGISALFAATAVPLEFGLGLAGALILNQGVRLRSVIIPVLFVPTMMAPVVVAILWKSCLRLVGLISSTSSALRHPHRHPVVASPRCPLRAGTRGVWQWTPFMCSLLSCLQSLP